MGNSSLKISAPVFLQALLCFISKKPYGGNIQLAVVKLFVEAQLLSFKDTSWKRARTILNVLRPQTTVCKGSLVLRDT